MLQRNLLYTGVTRVKRLVVLVGQKEAVAIAIRGEVANSEASAANAAVGQ
jgi:ATP-dependent exoDNAse (exonuclease V) alpha subunit